jgi:hypothetical protein
MFRPPCSSQELHGARRLEKSLTTRRKKPRRPERIPGLLIFLGGATEGFEAVGQKVRKGWKVRRF